MLIISKVTGGVDGLCVQQSQIISQQKEDNDKTPHIYFSLS